MRFYPFFAENKSENKLNRKALLWKWTQRGFTKNFYFCSCLWVKINFKFWSNYVLSTESKACTACLAFMDVRPLPLLMITSNTELMLIINKRAVAKYLTTNSTAKILSSVNSETKRPMQATIYTWITNCQKHNAYVRVLILYVGMLFLFWIYGCWRSSAKWASHLNLDEWTVNIAMLNCFLIVNA